MEQSSSRFATPPFNGIIGAGLNYSGPSPLETLAKANKISNSFWVLFAGNGNGFVDLGGSVDSHYTGSIKGPMPMLRTRATSAIIDYAVGVSGVRWGDDSFSITVPMLFDSGTSATLLPVASYNAFQDLYSSRCEGNNEIWCLDQFRSGQYTYKLTNSQAKRMYAFFPTMTFTFSGGFVVENTPQEYIRKDSTGYYGIGFVSGRSEDTFGIFGTPFLVNKYVGYDRDNLQCYVATGAAGFASTGNTDNGSGEGSAAPLLMSWAVVLFLIAQLF